CAKCTVSACFRGSEKAPGCPVFEFPKTMDNNARCNFCGYCVKNCPNDSITISARVPSKELWFIRKPKLEESFLAIVIMGIVFVQNITMLEIWAEAQQWLGNLLGTDSFNVIFTVAFIIAMAIPALLIYITSWFASLRNSESAVMNLTRFGYALIPLDFAGHMAHNLFHLLAEGKSVLYTGLALFGIKNEGASAALVSMETIVFLQYLLLVLGTLASIYTAYRIAKANYKENQIMGSVIPFAILILALGWTPCIGPVLASVLTVAATGGSILKGSLLLVAYSLGMAIPFLVLCLTFDRFPSLQRVLGKYSRASLVVSGILLTLLGALMFFNKLPVVTAYLSF
ncbi:MAG: 4Fe-4S binding protein, partial [Firmicutes bacterium]|nr:4Fe-4S binding protein [Bacillota bacterium]